MRKVFRETYRLLDEGARRRRLCKELPATGSTGRALKAALEQFDRMAKFDKKESPTEGCLIGLDEVGRGPLAGPLVAACVVLPSPPPLLPFLRDSKKLVAEEREFLVPRILQSVSHVGYGVVEAEEFGKEINLHHLTFLAMSRALNAANLPEGCSLLVDGKFPLPSFAGPQRAVVKGDDTSLSIAAASILAKVYRDEVMIKACRDYPQYGFSRNVGYGTEEHRKAILAHGPCPLHRPNFVASVLNEATQLSLF